MNLEQPAEKIGSMDGVTVTKTQLLEILKDNKLRHDAVLEVAQSGYWVTAQETISQKRQEFVKSIEELGEDFTYHVGKLSQKLERKEILDDTHINVGLKFNTALCSFRNVKWVCRCF